MLDDQLNQPLTQPNTLVEPICAGGIEGVDYITPPLKSTNTNIPTIDQGLPPIMSQPLQSGGQPVPRSGINGMLNLLSKFLVFLNLGGRFTQQSGVAYPIGAILWSPTLKRNLISLKDNNTAPLAVDNVNWAYADFPSITDDGTTVSISKPTSVTGNQTVTGISYVVGTENITTTSGSFAPLSINKTSPVSSQGAAISIGGNGSFYNGGSGDSGGFGLNCATPNGVNCPNGQSNFHSISVNNNSHSVSQLACNNGSGGSQAVIYIGPQGGSSDPSFTQYIAYANYNGSSASFQLNQSTSSGGFKGIYASMQSTYDDGTGIVEIYPDSGNNNYQVVNISSRANGTYSQNSGITFRMGYRPTMMNTNLKTDNNSLATLADVRNPSISWNQAYNGWVNINVISSNYNSSAICRTGGGSNSPSHFYSVEYVVFSSQDIGAGEWVITLPSNSYAGNNAPLISFTSTNLQFNPLNYTSRLPNMGCFLISYQNNQFQIGSADTGSQTNQMISFTVIFQNVN